MLCAQGAGDFGSDKRDKCVCSGAVLAPVSVWSKIVGVLIAKCLHTAHDSTQRMHMQRTYTHAQQPSFDVVGMHTTTTQPAINTLHDDNSITDTCMALIALAGTWRNCIGSDKRDKCVFSRAESPVGDLE